MRHGLSRLPKPCRVALSQPKSYSLVALVQRKAQTMHPKRVNRRARRSEGMPAQDYATWHYPHE
jgi:hypothetical protein